MQNTEQKRKDQNVKGPENSIFSLLKAFGQQQPHQIILVDKKVDQLNVFEENKSSNDIQIAEAINPNQSAFRSLELDDSNGNQSKLNRTGRFTVEAVKTSDKPELQQPKATVQTMNEIKYLTKRNSSLKQVAFQQSKPFHHRASSLPPTKQLINSTDDNSGKYKNVVVSRKFSLN